jgi:hypothetical protein
MVVQGRMEDVRRQLMTYREAVVTLLDRADEAKKALLGVPGVIEVLDMPDEQGRKRLRIHFNGDDQVPNAMIQAITGQGLPMVNFNEQSQDLETVFMKVTKGIVT